MPGATGVVSRAWGASAYQGLEDGRQCCYGENGRNLGSDWSQERISLAGTHYGNVIGVSETIADLLGGLAENPESKIGMKVVEVTTQRVMKLTWKLDHSSLARFEYAEQGESEELAAVRQGQ